MAGGPNPFTNAFDTLPTGSFRYNTSQAGTVIPIVFGTGRVSVNLLEFWGYSGNNGKGGKGGQAKSSKKAGNYYVYVAFCCCQGPAGFTGAPHGIGGNNRIWSNGGISAGVTNVGLNPFLGTDGQAPDPVFVAMDPNIPVIGYSGLCYVTGDPMQLGQSPALPNIGFEITGFQVGTIGPNYPGDANPSQIIQQLLTDSRWGAGFPAANIDATGSFADFANYCQAAGNTGLAMSPVLDRPQPAARWIDDWTKLCVAAVVWSGALLKIIPYATTVMSGNGGTWTPQLTPQYSFGDPDILSPGVQRSSSAAAASDPTIGTRNDPGQLTNWLSLEYYDSINSYNPNVVAAWDQGAIDLYGVRTEPSIQAHAFTNITVAQAAAQLMLTRKQQVRDTWKFTLNWRGLLLEPMDIIEVTDAGAGLESYPMRITGIDEGDNGELAITAEDIPIGPSPPQYPSNQPANNAVPLYEAPGSTNAPIVFEPPTTLSGGQNQIWILATGGANWGGANVWVSQDGSTYAMVGRVYTGGRQGTLAASLGNYTGANPDGSNTLAVNIAESGGQLISASSADAAAYVSLCYVDGELLSYQTATLTGVEQYSLSTLYRGAFGSKVSSHANGSQFGYVGLQPNPSVLRLPLPSNLIGHSIAIKLQAFNLFGFATQALSSVSPTTYRLLGTGTGANLVTADFPMAFEHR